ncbi:C-type lectin domain family 9 member A-like [Ochotona princeps]|uniref:C-type lectin domain family 9 member A-like n=1 Tax=Ochotona princeps TaxID=9978 RepID=UPI0027151EC9|nr:C-type lectin domain family 9 member A-like [Ochotona princeps]
MDSKLVKIEDEQQLNFIQSQIAYYSWIGLSRQGTASFWTWEDNSKPLLEFDWEESSRGNCGSITASTMAAADCAKRMHIICEKRL